VNVRLATLPSWLFSSGGTLAHRTARSGVWLGIGDGATRLAAFVKVVILARLLAPADFGVMGIALLFTTWITYFSELGFSAALIQRRDDIRPYLNTAWTANVARSLLIGALTFAAAPMIGWLFAEPAAVAIVRVLAFEVAIRGFVNPAVVYFRKDLDTRREVTWRLTGVAAGILVGVGVALAVANVWALVASVLAASLVDTLMSHWATRYVPAFRIDRAKLRELAGFGRWVFGFRAIGFFTWHLDSVVVGKAAGATALGFYQMAGQLAVAPITGLGGLVHGVLFPAFSQIDDAARRRAALLRTLEIVVSVALPLAVFLTVFADLLVRVGLGKKWSAIVPVIVVLGWVGFARTVKIVVAAFLLAIGRPDLEFRSTLPTLAILAAALYPATVGYGAIGAAVAVVAAVTAGAVYQTFVLARLVDISPGEAGVIARGALVASLPFAMAWIVVHFSMAPAAVVAPLSVLVYGIIFTARLHTIVSVRSGMSAIFAESA
jgi:O-antigen/teichoic acid export membrane protein